MRNPHYLLLSRHNVYYFRFQIPSSLHPQRKATDVKLSLNTRDPNQALQIARGLIYFAQTALTNPTLCAMEYQEIRDVLQSHFQQMRDRIKAQIQKQGQLADQDKADFSNWRDVSETALANGDYSQIGTDRDLGDLIEQYGLHLSQTSPD